jgi:DHA1 family bicyclomycin/chloramphenicol resistance-like MFS transporter
MVVGRAIISDLSENKAQAARGFSLLQTVLGVAPILAPWLGSVLVGPLGWRGTLWVIFGITLATLCGVLAFIRESHTPQRRHQARAQGTGRGLASLLTRRFLGNSLAFSLAFAAMMAYISASPFLFQIVIGLSVIQYGLLFALVALVLTATGALSAHLAARVPARRLLRLGLSLLLAGSLALVAIVFLGLPAVWTILPIAISIGSLGLVLGNATSSAIAAVPQAVGSGSAVLGALSFGLGALVVPLVGLRGERNAGPMALVMAVASLLALAAFLVAESDGSQEVLDECDQDACACDAE